MPNKSETMSKPAAQTETVNALPPDNIMKADLNDEITSQFLDFNNIVAAGDKCRKGKIWKDSVAGYMMNQLTNTNKLRTSCLNGTYKIREYSQFIIFEPKKREIQATRFNDRVLQKAIIDLFWYDAMTKGFIKENCACQKGKGTDAARYILKDNLQRCYRKHGTDAYVLKIDIKDFFGSTLKSVVCDAINKRTDNEYIQYLFREAVYNFKGKTEGVGVGLGSEVSQIAELAVLDSLDHFIKEKLRIKYYVRYMDDFILIHPDKEYLRYCYNEIIKYLCSLSLNANKKKTQIFKITQPIKFLGYSFRLTETGKVIIKVLPRKLTKRKRIVRKQIQDYLEGKKTKEEIDESFKGFMVGLQFGNNRTAADLMWKWYKEEWRKANETFSKTAAKADSH